MWSRLGLVLLLTVFFVRELLQTFTATSEFQNSRNYVQNVHSRLFWHREAVFLTRKSVVKHDSNNGAIFFK